MFYFRENSVETHMCVWQVVHGRPTTEYIAVVLRDIYQGPTPCPEKSATDFFAVTFTNIDGFL